jgi:hypothetical protein
MVNIDNVYQKVLSLANKEQRGYITPQEFNLFANQAQLEIFEQYFYDINQFGRAPGNENEYGDILNLLYEKISIFKFNNTTLIFTGGVWLRPTVVGRAMYRLGTVWHTPTTLLADRVEVQEINSNELMDILNSPLVVPTPAKPVYVEDEAGLTIYPLTLTTAGTIVCSWAAFPTVPRWGYVVISEKAMFDPTTTTNFELHPTEETELVYKILKYAGISMDKESISGAGQQMETTKTQQEKQ